MRIEFATTTHPARVAKTLAKLLNAQGDRTVKLADSQEITAAMFGYGSWRELAKAAGRSGESPWDEAVDEAERADRRSRYVSVLTARGIPDGFAAAIVDEIRPTSRRLKSVAPNSGWRDRLRKRIDPNGFFQVQSDLSRYEWPATFRDGFRHAMGRTRELPVVLPNGSQAVLRIRQFPNMTECGSVRVCPINSLLIGDGKLLGTADGFIVTAPRGAHTHEFDFFDACDQIEDDHAAAAHRLSTIYGMDELFGTSNALFVLQEWDAARGIAPPGTGETLIKSLLLALKRSYRIGAVAVDIHPGQFNDIDPDKRLRLQGYGEARKHLVAYWDRIAPHEVIGPAARTFHYDRQPGTGAAVDDGLLLLGRKMGMGDESQDMPPELAGIAMSLDEMTPEQEALIAKSHPVMAGMLMSATRTDPNEPKPLMPQDLPEGFDINWAAAARSFDPHPDLWRHMPTDIVSIKVHYGATKDGIRPVDRLVYRFENETELEIPGSYLIGGPDLGEMPPAFTAENGYPVIVNPYTDKYLMGRLSETLKINSLLLFSGNDARPLRWPDEAQKTRHEPTSVS